MNEGTEAMEPIIRFENVHFTYPEEEQERAL